MSFFGSMSDAKNANGVELSVDQPTSPVLNGASSPGGATSGTKPAGQTQVVGRLRQGIKTPLTRTDSLTRKL